MTLGLIISSPDMLSGVMLGDTFFIVILSVTLQCCYAECHYAERRYAECRGALKKER